MLSIYKYPLGHSVNFPVPTDCIVLMPDDAEIIHFDVVNNEFCIWARVDPLAPNIATTFVLRWTGNGSPDTEQHIGTHIDRDAGLVWHLFKCT